MLGPWVWFHCRDGGVLELGAQMRTNLQCLENAAHCERIARKCNSSVDAGLLLEMARQWRSLAGLSPAQSPPGEAKSSPPSPIDDATLERMLLDVGSPIR